MYSALRHFRASASLFAPRGLLRMAVSHYFFINSFLKFEHFQKEFDGVRTFLASVKRQRYHSLTEHYNYTTKNKFVNIFISEEWYIASPAQPGP